MKENTLTLWQDQTQLAEVKKIYGANLSDGEFQTFIQIGIATGLNPFLKEIWAIKYGSSPAQIFIGRDGYRKSAQSDPAYDHHIVDAVYQGDSFNVENGEAFHNYRLNDRGPLVGAYCKVKRKGAEKPCFVYVELEEYNTKKSVWVSKPATMIKKVAEAQGLRMAFQGLFAGTYSDSEDWHQDKPTNKVKTSSTPPGAPKNEAPEPMTEEQEYQINALGENLESDNLEIWKWVTKLYGNNPSSKDADKVINAMEEKLARRSGEIVVIEGETNAAKMMRENKEKVNQK